VRRDETTFGRNRAVSLVRAMRTTALRRWDHSESAAFPKRA
jgi:hypothetical protein